MSLKNTFSRGQGNFAKVVELQDVNMRCSHIALS